LSPLPLRCAARSNRKAATFHDLIDALKGRVVYRDKIIEKTKVVYPKVEELSPREIAQLCLDQDTSRLNDREREFLDDMSRRYGTPTPKQETWLFAIHDKTARTRKEILSFAPQSAEARMPLCIVN
jgi:hypothetical protein